MPPSRRILASCLSAAFSLFLANCGGGTGSTSAAPTTSTSSTVTSVSVSCAANSVPVGQTTQCSAKVQGTGSFNSAVSWSVSGIAGGNSTLGTITASGLYTAPAAVPTPYTVNVSATSSQDGTKSAYSSLIIAGTIASMSQTVAAAVGSILSLPDGSSVTIPENFLTADQTVTLTESSVLSQQPPNPLVIGIGPSLQLAFSIPIEPDTIARHARPGQITPQGSTPTAALQFTVNEQQVSSSLGGGGGMAVALDSSNNPTFVPLATSTNAGDTTANFTLTASNMLAGGTPVSSASVSTINMVYPYSLTPPTDLPAQLCWQPSSNTWGPFSVSNSSGCNSLIGGKRVVVLVHGMMSCVENGFVTMANSLLNDNTYDYVLGFDYDWFQHLADPNDNSATSSGYLSSFLTAIGKNNPSKIDIIAHSEGVPVSLYAASLYTASGGQIDNLVGLAGPIEGTPVAADEKAIGVFLVYYDDFDNGADVCPESAQFKSYSYSAVKSSPFVQNLQPGSQAINTILAAAQADLGSGSTKIFLGAGANPTHVFNLDDVYYGLDFPLSSPFGFPPFRPNDGIVGLDSALAFNAGIANVHPLPVFTNLFHGDLPGNADVISLIGSQLSQGSQTLSPTLSCENSAVQCSEDQNAPFQFLFTENGLSLESGSLKVFSQDSTGTVTPISPAFSYGSGSGRGRFGLGVFIGATTRRPWTLSTALGAGSTTMAGGVCHLRSYGDLVDGYRLEHHEHHGSSRCARKQGQPVRQSATNISLRRCIAVRHKDLSIALLCI